LNQVVAAAGDIDLTSGKTYYAQVKINYGGLDGTGPHL